MGVHGANRAAERPGAGSGSSREGRLHGLDLLRGIAMVLGVVLHASVPYSRFDSPWLYRVQTSTPVYDLTLIAIHAFRMPLFFLLAGYFARLQQERLGASGFFLQRLIRIGVPFLVGMVTLVPWLGSMALLDPTDLFVFLKAHQIPIPVGKPVPSSFWNISTFHLWFLETLLLCYALVWMLTLLGRGRLSIPGAIDRALEAGSRLVWPTAFLAVLGFVWFAGSNPGDGVPFLDYAVLRQGPQIVGMSLAFFVMGWLLHRNRTARDHLEARWRPFLVVGLLSLGLLLGVRWQLWRQDMKVSAVQQLLGPGSEALAAWFLSLGLFAWGIQARNRPIRWAAYFANASYWLYLIHLPLVFWIQLRMRYWQLPTGVKFLLCIGLVTSFGLLSYHLLVRNTWIGWILNGHRARSSGDTGDRRAHPVAG